MAKVWQPLSDGDYLMQGVSGTYTLHVSFGGAELEAWSNSVSNQFKDGSPRDIEEISIGSYRLCQRRQAAEQEPPT